MKCGRCQNKLDPRAINYHHLKAWADKGETKIKNGLAVCPTCHGILSHNDRLKKIEKPKKKTEKPKNENPKDPFDIFNKITKNIRL